MRVLVLGALMLAACSSQELTRQKAAAAIIKTYPIPVGGNVDAGPLNTDSKSMEQYLASPHGKMQAPALEADLITVRFEAATPKNRIHIALTEKGRELVIRRSDPNGLYKNFAEIVTVRMCELQFIEVTGIRKTPSPAHVEVEFTVSKANPTPFFKGLVAVYGTTTNPCGDQTPQKASVMFELFDDGWRLAQ